LLDLDLPSAWTAKLVDPAETTSLPLPDDETVMALSAVRSANEANGTQPTLLAMQYPRHELSLEAYISGVAEAMGERVEVQRAGIVFDVREDGKPVGVLQYGDETVSGYQVVQFDDKAESLILLTFTVPTAQLDEYMDEFHQIAAAVDAR
jgi:hypothetical protein